MSLTLTVVQTKIAEDYIQLITEEAKPTVTNLKDLIALSKSDATRNIAQWTLTYGKWPMTNTDPDVNLYCNIKDELTIMQNGIILRSHSTCTPKSLQKEVVDIARCGHQSMTRTKQLLREKVCFSSMDRITEEKVKNCFPYQAVTPKDTYKPI